MILHGNEIADIRKGDTITSPELLNGAQLRTFDFAVANPPFSVKSWSNGLENDYSRFEFGRPPEKNGDYAFLLHVLKSLKSTGKAAVILPHGVLFRGNAEATIRKALISRGYIKGVIGLPANLFYGTGIPACIVVLDKENAHARTGIFMIDASKGFMKDGPKNRLRSQDLHKIVDVFNKQIEVDRYSRMVSTAEIADPKNDFNLNIPRYIDSSEPEDLQDLHAHLHGGIPERDIDALAHYWDAFPQLRSQLFKANRPGYSDLTVDVNRVQQTILDSPEFQKFVDAARDLTAEWFSAHREALGKIDADTRPNALISAISDGLLERFKSVPLLDEYDVYEQLMSYWHSSMHDDVFLIMNEGWLGAAKPRAAIEDKDRKLSETPDLVIGTGKKALKYKMDLVPPVLIVSRWFADSQERVDELNAVLEAGTQAVEEHAEEYGGDEGLLSDAVNDKGKLTQALVKDALQEARSAGDEEAIDCAQKALGLLQTEAAGKKAAKDAQSALDTATLKKYGELTEADVRSLVLDDKWAGTICNRVAGEVKALTLALVSRIHQLGVRYATTLDELALRVRQLEQSADVTLSHASDSEHIALIRLRDVGATYGGLTGKTKADFGHGDALFVTFMEVMACPRLRGAQLERVNVTKGENQNRVLKGDLLFNGSSETSDEVALSAVVVYDPTQKTYLNSFCFGYRLKRLDVVDPVYLAYFFRSRQGRQLVSALAQGAIRYNIAKTKFLELEVPLPALERQRDVVAALTQSEDLVEAIRLLAAKRRMLGSGLTQQLLSGADISTAGSATR